MWNVQCHQHEEWLKSLKDIIRESMCYMYHKRRGDFLAMHKKNVTFETASTSDYMRQIVMIS